MAAPYPAAASSPDEPTYVNIIADAIEYPQIATLIGID